MNFRVAIDPKSDQKRMFVSFWMAGFESASHINSQGNRLDMLAGVEHDKRAARDYAMLRPLGIRTVRDGVRWHLIDRGGTHDLSSFLPMLLAAREEEVQVLWTLCHYGWPDDVDVFSAKFVDRFASYARAIATAIHDTSDDVTFYTPINEVSFLSWAAERNLVYPFATGRGGELKRQFVRATIAACEAIWQVDSRSRFLHADPVIHVAVPAGRPDLAAEAQAYSESQYEAMDMLAGRSAPDLGGATKYLDIVGLNYYHANQWEHLDGRLRWEDEPRDSRWLPFRDLIRAWWERYGRPVVISETSHFGAGRAKWIREISFEVFEAINDGVPVEGICLYPILDRYDWEDPSHWHHSGLFDVRRDESPDLDWMLNREYADSVAESQALLSSIGKT